jgi:hypothetical protein
MKINLFIAERGAQYRLQSLPYASVGQLNKDMGT